MPQVFDPRNHEWREARAEVEQLLTPEELAAAHASTLNAHYTSPTVVRAMYRALERFGFEHGRILEPACGIGHFIGLMPEAMHRHSTITGVEIDPLTSRIARALYPDADIRAQPFEQTKLADGFYDVAISNVPFGDYPVHDPLLNAYRFPIHDYFFAKALDKVRHIESTQTHRAMSHRLRAEAGQRRPRRRPERPLVPAPRESHRSISPWIVGTLTTAFETKCPRRYACQSMLP
jgi:hypothetical protein